MKDLRKYLIKIGPSRRVGQILVVKKDEANNILSKYNNFLQLYKSKVKEFSEKEKSVISDICVQFNQLYTELMSLLSSDSNEGKESYSSAEYWSESLNMAEDTFDLKIALSLLPVMTDQEDVTKQLIENIEYYDSVLSKPICKKKLINFVLKSRLSQTAKLKLCLTYDTTDDLIRDMRRQLLPHKSPTAIQAKLQYVRQNEKTIADYGKQLSELFVDLTISQADGNSTSYDILKPINEKYAIKRFADGLRNRRLSTIIAARNFDSLKDAIQSAQDEEVLTTSKSEEIFYMQRPHSTKNTGRSYFNRANRGQYRGQRGFYPRGIAQNNRQHYTNVRYSTPSYFSRSPRGSNYRGRLGKKRTVGNSSSKHVNVIQTADEESTLQDHPEAESLSHFFRS